MRPIKRYYLNLLMVIQPEVYRVTLSEIMRTAARAIGSAILDMKSGQYAYW
jgi:hypothetical protein